MSATLDSPHRQTERTPEFRESPCANSQTQICFLRRVIAVPKLPQHSFKFCPKCGDKAVKVGGNPFHCPSCGFTYHFGPAIAVGAIICDRTNRVLLIRRARNPGKGKWGLPGGFVDLGETAEAAVAREVEEEVRLSIHSPRYLASYLNDYKYKGMIIPIVDLFFTCEVDDLDSIEHEPNEVSETVFGKLQPKYLNNMAFESNRLRARRVQTSTESKDVPKPEMKRSALYRAWSGMMLLH
ncbi:MAG: NUDIX domain-containing protein [Pirellulaceae bacterium]